MTYSEEDVVKTLTERFKGITPKIQRKRRIWLDSPRKGLIELLAFLNDELGFNFLCTISGVDTGEDFQLIYHLSHDCGTVLNVRVSAPHSDPVFDTVTDIYKGGMLYELEARNLLGLKIKGIPKDISYPLPDNWPKGVYPLRKDWTVPTDDENSKDAATEEDENG